MISNIQTPMERKRKSDKLSKREFESLMKYVQSFPTIIDAAFAIGIHRNVLDRVLLKGTGSPETIGLVRGKLNAKKAN